jgi:asparagine synthase (glutamine-hydrolysing)
MMAGLAHRGPDGHRICHRPPVVLGHQHHWTTPEEQGEQQPLVSSDDRFHLVLDGRLDNRDELLSMTEMQSPALARARQLSDAALLVELYSRLRERCFAHLIGPFVIVIYDRLAGRVICARDALGDRTLFYHLSARLLVLASEEASLLSHPAVSRQPNEESLAAYYAVRAARAGTTLYRDVNELLPGHYLSIDHDQVRQVRFWAAQPGPDEPLPEHREAQYIEQLRSSLEVAVRARLRAGEPPAVLMSGGLDSTAVAALAARKLAFGGNHVRLTTISWVFDELPAMDERTYIDAMAVRYDLRSIQLTGDDAWPLRVATRQNPGRPDLSPFRELSCRAFAAAHEAGARVLLSGWFDHVYSGGSAWLAELIRNHRRCQALAELRGLVSRCGVRGALRDPFLRGALRRLVPFPAPAPAPCWLTPQARAMVQDIEDWPPQVASTHRPDQYRSVLGLLPAHVATGEIYHASRAGIELRYPYRDRRLVELMLSLPAYMLYRSGIRKYITVRAMEGILPDQVRCRKEITSLYPLYLRGMYERELGALQTLLERPGALWRRYVNSRWLHEEITCRRATSLVLWVCASMELWRGETDEFKS